MSKRTTPAPRTAEIVNIERNYTQAIDETGEYHNFVHGSINGVAGAEVGQTGRVEYHTAARYGLWFWIADPK